MLTGAYRTFKFAMSFIRVVQCLNEKFSQHLSLITTFMEALGGSFAANTRLSAKCHGCITIIISSLWFRFFFPSTVLSTSFPLSAKTGDDDQRIRRQSRCGADVSCSSHAHRLPKLPLTVNEGNSRWVCSNRSHLTPGMSLIPMGYRPELMDRDHSTINTDLARLQTWASIWLRNDIKSV